MVTFSENSADDKHRRRRRPRNRHKDSSSSALRLSIGTKTLMKCISGIIGCGCGVRGGFFIESCSQDHRPLPHRQVLPRHPRLYLNGAREEYLVQDAEKGG